LSQSLQAARHLPQDQQAAQHLQDQQVAQVQNLQTAQHFPQDQQATQRLPQKLQVTYVLPASSLLLATLARPEHDSNHTTDKRSL
jgi:negative regulator of replication initiation